MQAAKSLGAILAVVLGPIVMGHGASAQAQPAGLTAVAGLKVGHVQVAGRPTGCTVVLAEGGAVGGVDVRGSAPGTRETDLLNPINTVEKVHAVVLSGGSAFGLDTASGGLGTASITTPDGLIVAALVAVNAVGDVIDPATGRVIAGVRTLDGKGLADARVLLRSGALTPQASFGRNTTIGVVATNAALTKAQATKMAQMAQDGLARTISPAHTVFDGDTIFALSTGTRKGAPNMMTIGALAAEAVAEAVLRAVRAATGIPGYPSAADLAAVR